MKGTFNSRRGGLLIHTAAFISGGFTMAALTSDLPASSSSFSSSSALYTLHSSSYSSPSSLSYPPLCLSTADPLSSASSSSPSSSSTHTGGPASTSSAANMEASAQDESRYQPKYSFSSPHFALGNLPLFAKARVRLGELFTGLPHESADRTTLNISLQLRRSPKTLDEIEEERYWQEGEETEEDEEW